MSSELQKPSVQETSSRITEEYRVLHKVAKILQNPGELNDILQKTMQAIRVEPEPPKPSNTNRLNG